ncbi:MAG: hypothetical protein AABW73_00975 [Nanoarchaeota archaeon]
MSFDKKKYSKLLLTITIIVMMLVLLKNVSAIGISPGRTTINFEPNLEKDVSLTIINTDKKTMTVVLYARGELKDYVQLSSQSVQFSEGEETKTVNYKIRLPSNIEKPGLGTAEIVALEVSKETKIKTPDGEEIIVIDSPAINARIAVISQLHVYSVHPGKYLDAGLDVINTDEGEVKFIIPITSRGKIGIGEAQTTIDIYTSLNQKVATINTNKESLESQQTKELYATWKYNKEEINPGKYRAVATTTYDGETAYSDKDFEIGNKNLEIESITINNFKLGEIAKFNILVNNEWSEPVKDVNVQMQVYNEQGQTMADFTSQNYNVEGLTKKELVSYWDTVGVKSGTYKGKLILKYEDKIIERTIEVTISNNAIEVAGFTGKAIFPSTTKWNTQNVLIGIVILLVIINAVWFFLFLRKKKKAEGK